MTLPQGGQDAHGGPRCANPTTPTGRTHHPSNCRRTRTRSQTILKALAEPEPQPFQTPPREAPVFGPFPALVDRILADDERAPPKQRHTAMPLLAASATRTTGNLPATRSSAGSSLRSRFRSHPCRLPRRTKTRARADENLELLERSRRDRVAHGTHRSGAARHERGVRVFRLRAARSRVGQPDHRDDPGVSRSRPASPICGPRIPLGVHAEVLSACDTC